MIGEVDGADVSGRARIEALSRRFGSSRIAGDGRSFETLLADAVGGLVRELPADLTNAEMAAYEERPAGALGITVLGSNQPTSLPDPSQLSASGDVSADEASATDEIAADGGIAVDDTSADGASDNDVPVDQPAVDAAAVTSTVPAATQAMAAAAVGSDGFDRQAVLAATFSTAGQTTILAGLDLVGGSSEIEVPAGDPTRGDAGPADLVRQAFRAVGVEMPVDLNRQAEMGVEVSSLDDALPGDLLVFGSPVDHVALYAGDGSMLHAPAPGAEVQLKHIERPVAEIRRVVTPGAGDVASAVSLELGEWSTPAVEGVASDSRAFSPSEAERAYQTLFDQAGGEWQVPPALLAAVAETESGFNPSAVSPVGAQGLMQFMPATAAEMGVDPWDPASAIDGAARYLRTSIEQFEDPELAIASYNAGRGAVSRYGGIPPFPETQNYVRKVLDAWRSRS